MSEDFWRLYFVVLQDDEPIVRRQPRVQQGFPGAGLRAERHHVGHPLRRGAPTQRRRLTEDAWERTRRDDIEPVGVQARLPTLGLA
ncbi:hypothetical protein [Kitasatospora griseola]|uniref:hypothetical protein n=1 Tax=Kitasatospora griseola TaxID=2064 RepID=UPI00365F4B6E